MGGGGLEPHSKIHVFIFQYPSINSVEIRPGEAINVTCPSPETLSPGPTMVSAVIAEQFDKKRLGAPRYPCQGDVFKMLSFSCSFVSPSCEISFPERLVDAVMGLCAKLPLRLLVSYSCDQLVLTQVREPLRIESSVILIFFPKGIGTAACARKTTSRYCLGIFWTPTPQKLLIGVFENKVEKMWCSISFSL